MKTQALSLALAALLCTSLAAAAETAVPPEAVTLRNRALAELENEQPANAEAVLRELVKLVPEDPLPHADLAIALLRQQKTEEALAAADQALAKAPGRPDLIAIRAEVLQWSGREPEALALLEKAAAGAPRDLEILYGLYRLGGTLGGEEGEAAAGRALDRLAELRPENTVVLSALGRRAIAAGDRTAATGAYLRLEELAWQGPDAVREILAQVLAALEEGDLAAARVPALRLENVLKVTPMFQQSLRELSMGIQGVPLSRFAGEPPPAGFGEPVPVTFRLRRLEEAAGVAGSGPTLVAVDLDGDERPDLARLVTGAEGQESLEVRLSSAEEPRHLPAPQGLSGLLAADLDNDGHMDLLAWGAAGTLVWRGGEGGSLAPATADFGLGEAKGTAAAVLDFDIEGDLDLALFGTAGGGLFRNSLQGPLAAVGAEALPAFEAGEPRHLLASDLDRDGDLDLLLAHAAGLTWLDNLRQGRFAERTDRGGLGGAPPARWAASADLDNDGHPDLVTVGEGGSLAFWHNRGGGFAPWRLAAELPEGLRATQVQPFDADNDGRLDLALAGAGGVAVLAQRPGPAGPRFTRLTVAPAAEGEAPGQAAPFAVTGLAAGDLDRDGDLDLVASGPGGLHLVDNEGGNANRWLAVRLRGLDTGNSKNNLFGLGSTVEVVAGSAYQFREAQGEVTHFGLGSLRSPDLLRVTWTNGVPQNRLAPEADQRVVEEQVLKGSCPFLYAWDGEEMTFVTDLLWGAPAGLPLAPGVWAFADPQELVRVDGLAAAGGHYRLAVTEELWEAAFFDLARLWVVDHPAEVEVASSLKVLPGETVPEQVLGSREVRPVAAAWDGRGREVTARVLRRDEVYADGYEKSPYQGMATEPWAFTFDLGEAPAMPVRLLLDGWIFPTDASLNLAIAQRGDLAWAPPRLEVETAAGWQVLMPAMGFPAGKTKTLVVDTPTLPAGARRLRIVTTLWLHWDRIAWTTVTADGAPRVVAKLAPADAVLAYRGFSRPARRAPNGPHVFDWARVTADSPWLPFPGRYTRYGDVRELLLAADDRSVILAPGDAMELVFDASALPPPPEGFRRTLFLESHGWDKDADKNTWEGDRVEPLPFRAMSGYPYGPGESFPDTPLHREYRDEWLTREVEGD